MEQDITPEAIVDARAFLLLGESDDAVEEALTDYCGQLGMELDALGASEAERISLTATVAQAICHRLNEWRSVAGHA